MIADAPDPTGKSEPDLVADFNAWLSSKTEKKKFGWLEIAPDLIEMFSPLEGEIITRENYTKINNSFTITLMQPYFCNTSDVVACVSASLPDCSFFFGREQIRYKTINNPQFINNACEKILNARCQEIKIDIIRNKGFLNAKEFIGKIIPDSTNVTPLLSSPEFSVAKLEKFYPEKLLTRIVAKLQYSGDFNR